MTKEITKAYILQQMQDKFGLRDLEPETFRFSEMVVPTYDIEKHIESATARFQTVSVTAGPAGYLFFTVSPTLRWTIQGYNIIFMAAGAYTVTGLYIVRALEKFADSFIYLDMTLGQSASYAVNLPKPLTLESGDKIYVYVDSYTSTANLRVYLDYVEETLR